MPARRSAGVLLYRRALDGRGVEVLLGHMGGPFWSRRDATAWTVPKGECGDGEDPLATAVREFEEEMGSPPATAELLRLGEVRQSGGKVVTVWYGEGDVDAKPSSDDDHACPPPEVVHRAGRRRR